jgi:hypothetical protein
MDRLLRDYGLDRPELSVARRDRVDKGVRRAWMQPRFFSTASSGSVDQRLLGICLVSERKA